MVLCQRKQISGRKAHILAPDKTRRTGFSATFVPHWLDDGPIVDDVAVKEVKDALKRVGFRK